VQSGKHVLAASISPFDPKRTLSLAYLRPVMLKYVELDFTGLGLFLQTSALSRPDGHSCRLCACRLIHCKGGDYDEKARLPDIAGGCTPLPENSDIQGADSHRRDALARCQRKGRGIIFY
jgi:hypothetical protein